MHRARCNLNCVYILNYKKLQMHMNIKYLRPDRNDINYGFFCFQ